jgi:hypothetical protein
MIKALAAPCAVALAVAAKSCAVSNHIDSESARGRGAATADG